MPDIIKGTKRKTPISGGGAYLDYGGGTGGGSRTVSQTPAKTPSRSNDYQIGRLQGVRSSGSSGALKRSTGASGGIGGKIPGMYDTQRNALAANTALERRSFDERAVASGLNTGTTGQAELARSALLQQGMADLGQSEADALAEIDLAKSQLQAEYENAIAQQKAQDEATLLERLYEEAVRQQNARLSAASRSSGSSSGSSSGGRLANRVAEAVGATGSKTTNAVNAAADKVKSIADAILGSIPGTRSSKATSSSGSQLVSVPGYGQISYDDAERLEQQGYIRLRGVDSAGNPVYTKTAAKATGPLALSR